jgi:alkyl hydroperoxide reductase subunit AhpC
MAHRVEAKMDYLLLEDPENIVAGRLGIIDPVDDHEGQRFAVPVSILVDAEGIVRYAPTPDHVGTYVDPRTVIDVINALET